MTTRLLCPADIVERYGCSTGEALELMRACGAIETHGMVRVRNEDFAPWMDRRDGLERLWKEFTELAGNGADGYVYFARDNGTGSIKIGFTKDPERRIYKLRLGSPFGTEYELVLRGSPALERRCHDFFTREQIRAEWFRREGWLALFLDRFAKKMQEKSA